MSGKEEKGGRGLIGRWTGSTGVVEEEEVESGVLGVVIWRIESWKCGAGLRSRKEGGLLVVKEMWVKRGCFSCKRKTECAVVVPLSEEEQNEHGVCECLLSPYHEGRL